MSDIGAEIGLREPLEDIKKRIISKLPDHLPSYQRAQRNMVGIDRGSFNRATLWNDSPEGVAIHSREIGGPSFDLLRPIRDKVTTYDEGAGSSDSLLEFVRGQGVDATSYLTAKPVTVSEAEIADDASIPNSFKGTKWHEKNMAYTTNGGLKTHYLIDREGGRTIVVEELVVNPWKNPGSFGERGQKKAAARLVDEMPQIKSYAERDGHYFKVLGAMTYDDLSFYEEALDAYIDVTDPRTKVGKLVGDKGKEFLGYVNKKWRKIVHRTTQNPAVVIDKASSHHEETPKSDSLGEALNTLFEKEYFSLKELQEPVFQRFITDPEVPVEQITDIFINTRGVIPDAFAAYQYFRIFSPQAYEHVINETGGYIDNRLSASGMALDVRLNALHRVVQRAAEGDKEAQVNLSRFQGSLLKLNEIIVSGQDPASFDWKNFIPPTAPQKE